MKGKKFISKRFKVLFVIILTIVAVIISSKVLFNTMQSEQKMLNSYEMKKQKCELLKEIAHKSIQEGISIDTRKISNDEIQYSIYNNNERIIFYYYLQDDSTTERRYNATITLSNEYKILKEEYSIEIESFDEYVKSHNSANRILSVLYALLFIFSSYLLIYIFVIIISFLLKICIDRKKKQLITNNKSKAIDTINFLGQRYYLIHGRKENKQVLTAKELYERVMKDSKSDYNWIAPAKELVRICKKTNFPTDYATDIKIAILNCFANIEHMANCGGDRYIDNTADRKAVEYCYNSLYDINNKRAVNARQYYLSEMIKTASYVSCPFDSLYHPGPTYQNICKNWRKSKFEEYISKEEIEFDKLVETLHDDFKAVIKNAETNGDFEEDDKKYKEDLKMFYLKMMDID